MLVIKTVLSIIADVNIAWKSIPAKLVSDIFNTSVDAPILQLSK